MLQVEVDRTVCYLFAVFYQLGIWSRHEESYRRGLIRRTLYVFHYFSFFIFIATRAIQSDNDDEKLILMEVAIGVVILMVKLYYLLWKTDEILTFFEDPIVTHCMTTNDDYGEVQDKVKKIGKYFRAYITILIFTAIVVILLALPIFTGEKTLPIFMRFDSDSESFYDTILYCMSFFFISTGIITSVIYNGFMLFIWYVMYNYSIEYKVLGNRFKALGGSTYEQELVDLIRSHKNLSRYIDAILVKSEIFFFIFYYRSTVEEFRSCFSGLFLGEISTGAVSICVSTYNLSYVSKNFSICC